jgi:hypothetical protein
MTVWQHYQEGRLTKLDRDTMRGVYPVIYEEQCAKLLAIAHGPKAPKLSASQIAQIDMYTGGALGTNRNLTDIQQALQTSLLLHALQGKRASVVLSRDYLNGKSANEISLLALKKALDRLTQERGPQVNLWTYAQPRIRLSPLPDIPGGRRGTYLFIAELSKPQIRTAVQELFKVKVTKVNTLNVRGKARRHNER